MHSALSRAGTGIVAPTVLDDDGELHHSLRREPTLRRAVGLNRTAIPAFSEYLGRDSEYATPRKVDWALGAVLLISAQCFEAAGGWDDSYFLYSEETDFCLRARDLGYDTWYEPRAVVHHIGGQSGQGASIHAMQIVNRVRLYRRRNHPVPAVVYYALTILSELSWALRGGGANSWHAVKALVRPRSRPPELRCSEALIPR
jgi:GT2 family glycosyltransferase